MDKFESKLFGLVHAPSSFEELVSASLKMGDEKETVRIWRGQRNID